jgi:ketosteroid isomerase-like protein
MPPDPAGCRSSIGRAAESEEAPPVTDETDRIASDFFAAIERGDLDAVRELYSPDVQIWHNVTGKTQTRDENLALLRFFTGRVSERRYEVLAREFFPGGFVQRHVLHGKLGSGALVAAPVCLVVYLSKGKIVRLFEYLDPASVRAAFA